MMIIIASALVLIFGLVYYAFSDLIDESRFMKNMDMRLSGFVKAIAIALVCMTALTWNTFQANAPSMAETVEYVNDGVIDQTNQALDEEEEATLAQVESASSAGGGALYADGVYQGSGQGFKGTVTMEVEIESGEIIRVEAVSQRDDRKWFNRAITNLSQTIIAEQSADVDVVSGATFSSQGIIEGVANALEESLVK